MADVAERARQIGAAACELSERGLSGASARITELLTEVDPNLEAQVDVEFEKGREEAFGTNDRGLRYTMALNYFRMQEYLGAEDRLRRCSSVEGAFMRCQSRVCAEEKERRC